MVVTFWAGADVIHLTIGGAPVKTVRSHLSAAGLTALAATGARPAGPPPLPPAEPGAALEVDRIVSKDGAVHLAGRYVLAAEILGGPPYHIRARLPHGERRRRPGRARLPGRLPAARRRSRLRSRPPLAPVRRSIPGRPRATRAPPARLPAAASRSWDPGLKLWSGEA
jgi:hypothetical protein